MKRISHIHAKLFLTTGAFLSGASLVVAGIATLPAKDGLVFGREGQAAAVILKDTNQVRDIPPSHVGVRGGTSTLAILSAHASLLDEEIATNTERLIIADLTQKYVAVVDATTTIATFPILSIGREGTSWETPSGNYAVRSKEAQHRSTIGGTWMPWSMQFYGNYFIHGWPTHDDGTPVPPGYSGGCIRLSTEDAHRLYDLVQSGTVVHVRGAQPAKAITAQYFLEGTDPLPEISATGFLVTDLESGDVLWSRGLDDTVNPGRLVSLMTALVSAETIDQYKWIDYEQFVKGADVTKVNKSNPSALQIGALMYPLLYDGADVAAEGISAFRGHKQFRKYMNEKSEAIGMKNTSWGGASSYETSTSTIRDLGRLLSYIDVQKSFLIKASASKEHSFGVNGTKRFTWTNDEPLLSDGEYQGGLIARDTLGTGDAMAVFSLPLGEFATRRVGIVALHAKNIDDTLAYIKNTAKTRFVFMENTSGNTALK